MRVEKEKMRDVYDRGEGGTSRGLHVCGGTNHSFVSRGDMWFFCQDLEAG